MTDFMDMDVSTVLRIIAISEAVARFEPQYLKMPTPEDIKYQTQFYNVVKFPKAVGLVDGTHIKIQWPVHCYYLKYNFMR